MTPHYATHPHPDEIIDARHPLDRALDPRTQARAMSRDSAELCTAEESRDLARSVALHMAVGAGVPAFIFWGIPMVAQAIQWGGRLLGGMW